jgi:nitrite reductase (NADH) large subunit
MKIVIIGNGLAGTMAAKSLRELDSSVDIEIVAEERHPYYPRPNLIDYLAGRLPFEKLFAFPANWQERQNILIRSGEPVTGIDAGRKRAETRSGHTIPYDRLLLAAGSSSFVPPLKGTNKNRVFTLRTLDDAQAILEALKSHTTVAVIGGGLLGLEIARALKERGASVTVYEVMDRLLPRQLDPAAASLLKARIEKAGIVVRLGVETEEILGENAVSGLRFKGGETAAADLVVLASGVRPNLELARQAGLAADRGLVVNDLLQTSHPAIFGAGDMIQHRDKVYGIIPASFDQARVAAFNLLSPEKRYEGSVPSNTLKIHGIPVTSVGQILPTGNGFEIVVKESGEEGIYKKIVLREGALEGAIWMGTSKGAADIVRLAASRTNIAPWKKEILEDGFDFSAV